MSQVVKQAPNQYFEGILQLRNPKKKVIDFIIRSIKKQKKKSKKSVYITKELKVKNGVDFYFSSKKFLRTLSNQLFSEFGGKVSLNEKLFSMDRNKSKLIYRLNVLFKPPEFEKGDVVLFNDKLVLVKKIGKKVTGSEIINNKNISFKYSDKIKKLEVYKTTVSKVKPNVEVLHPETYESVEVKNKKLRKLKLGEKVKIVRWKGVYVV